MSFFGGGEALLQPFTTDLVGHASSVGLLVELLTHSYWEDQTRIQKLALATPWLVTVSLDAASETHTKIHGREKFYEKTTRTIETLPQMRKEMDLNFDIRLKTVTMVLQMQANGDVTICEGLKAVGNIKEAPIRQIWETRPPVREQGCCRTWRCSPAEKEAHALPVLS